MEYDSWNRSGLKKELTGVRGFNVEPKSQSIFFSGPEISHRHQGFRNSDRAARYAAREGITTIQKTERGHHLAGRQRIIRKLAEKTGGFNANVVIGQEWVLTSRNYADLAHGHVKAFVAGAGRDDIFRRIELRPLIDNLRVQTINGISRTKLDEVAARKNGLDRAYNMIVRAGFRQDMQQALRTGDRTLIRDALAQKQLYENQLRLDCGEQLDLSPEAKKKREDRLDRSADRLAAIQQSIIRTEAVNEAKAYVDSSHQAGNLTPEQADRITRRTEQAAQNPQKAYRIRELARLKIMLDKATQDKPDTRGINEYLNRKEQYKSDVRAVRQANGQHFAESSPIDRQINRRHQYRSIAGHARLKCSHRHGRVRDKAQKERGLDQHLQDRKRHEPGKTGMASRPKMRRDATPAGSHGL